MDTIKKHNNKWFIWILVTWILAWPTMMFFAMLVLVLPNNDKLTPQLMALFFIEFLLFIYGLLGWIPLLIIWYKDKRL